MREFYCLWYIDMVVFDFVFLVLMFFIDFSVKDFDNCERFVFELFYLFYILVCFKVYFFFIFCVNNL